MLGGGCDHVDGFEDDDVIDREGGLEPEGDPNPEGWIIPGDETSEAINPQHTEVDNDVVADIEFEGAKGVVIELPGDDLGVVWTSIPSGFGDGHALSEYSPLEMALANDSAAVDNDSLVAHHQRLARQGVVPSSPRLVARGGAEPDPSQATDYDYAPWCGGSSPWGYFLFQWTNFVRYRCWGLCGSESNDNTGQISLTNYYIVAANSAETALLGCNGDPVSGDRISMQVQIYNGTGWSVVHSQNNIPAYMGVAFTRYGFTLAQYRMRVFNISSGTTTYAAAIW